MELEEFQHRYERWLTTTQDLSKHTVRAYMADVSAFEQFLGHGFEPRILQRDDLIGFVEHLTLAGRSSTTIKRRLSGVRSFCSWLVRVEALAENPAADLGVRFSRPRRLPRAVSRSDLRQLIAFLSGTAQLGIGPLGPIVVPRRRVEGTTLLAVLLMVGTGMRVGELTQVRPSDVDLSSRTIRVVGKGLRERMVYLSNDAIVSLLGSYLEGLPAGHVSATILNNRSGRALTTGALRTRLGRAGVACGMSVPLTPHMLRHTAATQLIEAGVDIRFVQRLLGHASLTTTEIYTHVADRSLRHAVVEADVLGGFLTCR